MHRADCTSEEEEEEERNDCNINLKKAIVNVCVRVTLQKKNITRNILWISSKIDDFSESRTKQSDREIFLSCLNGFKFQQIK